MAASSAPQALPPYGALSASSSSSLPLLSPSAGLPASASWAPTSPGAARAPPLAGAQLQWDVPAPVQYDQNLLVESGADGRASRVEIEYFKTTGGHWQVSPSFAATTHVNGPSEPVFFTGLTQWGTPLRQVKITLNGGGCRVESHHLHYHLGHVQADAALGGIGNMAKNFVKSKLTDVSTVRPHYTGTGEVFLEPTHLFYSIIKLSEEVAIVSAGTFVACEDTIAVDVFRHGFSIATTQGERPMWAIELKGSGWVVLHFHTPPAEFRKVKLNNARLCIERHMCPLVRGNIKITFEKSMNTLIGSAASGEGRLHVYTGTGEVWLAATHTARTPLMHYHSQGEG